MCYNVKHNSLEWVNQEGEFPRGYLGVKPILHGDTVIVFGVGGMKTLDMNSMRWKKIFEYSTNTGFVFDVFRYTLTKISDSTAVLLGAHEGSSVCWFLNLNNVINCKDHSTIWTKVPLRFFRGNHGAVWNAVNRELWVVGGIYDNLSYKDVLRISFDLSPLKDIALDCVARNICTCDPRLAGDQLPLQLKNKLMEYKANFGVDWLIHQQDTCKKDHGVREIITNLSLQKKAKLNHEQNGSKLNEY